MRANDLFDSMLDPVYLEECYKRAARGKRDRIAVARFATELESNIHEIIESLDTETYDFGPYRSFYVLEPKLRYIESACFPDRVVHHAIFGRLEPLFDMGFYEHSYACRAGRGSHAAMSQLKTWLRNPNLKYYLKCDVRKFFPSIDREILLKMLRRRIEDKKMMRLLEKLLINAPGTGLPIGNLTSQLFANVYLGGLDLFVKRQLSARYYIRYMDDFILLCESQEEAERLRVQVEVFLERKLKLQLSPHKVRIDRVNRGIQFVGYSIFPWAVRLRGAALRRIRRKVLKRFRAEVFKSNGGKDPFSLGRVRNSSFYGAWCSFLGQSQFSTYGLDLVQQMRGDILREWKENGGES